MMKLFGRSPLVVGHITVDIRPPAPPCIAHNVYWWWWLGLLRQKCTAACLGAAVWHTFISASSQEFFCKCLTFTSLCIYFIIQTNIHTMPHPFPGSPTTDSKAIAGAQHSFFPRTSPSPSNSIPLVERLSLTQLVTHLQRRLGRRMRNNLLVYHSLPVLMKMLLMIIIYQGHPPSTVGRVLD